MKERLFRFKQFSVSHKDSAMKVGVDGVLTGAWASVEGKRILDAGCGCGLIALMMAQRAPESIITAIDVDRPSVMEARRNVGLSPWPDRISVEEISFDALPGKFDHIVSNPPFFDSGISAPSTAREISRHQGTLSPNSLIAKAPLMLNPGGLLTLIAPAEMADKLKTAAHERGMELRRVCYVRDNPSAQEKRVLMELMFGREGFPVKIDSGEATLYENKDIGHSAETREEHLILFDSSGVPSEAYRCLCSPFYLKF